MPPDVPINCSAHGWPMDVWPGTSAGGSACCVVCGTSECRTVEVDANTFETIPDCACNFADARIAAGPG